MWAKRALNVFNEMQKHNFWFMFSINCLSDYSNIGFMLRKWRIVFV